MKRYSLFFSLIFIFCVPGVIFPESNGSRGDALKIGELEKLSGGFSFTEGPASDRDGNVYFTDQPNNRIMKWSTDDILSVFMKPAGRSNGLYFDLDGDLIACADEKNQLWEISPEGETRVLLDSYEGKLLNGPNDVWVRNDGSLYFTDPFYRRPYWTRAEMEQPGPFVYHVSPDRTRVTVVEDSLVSPNGIIGTADGNTLFIADIRGGKTYKYRIAADGKLSGRQLFCEMGSDGMTLDQGGNLYLTGKGVSVFDPEGNEIAHIDVPEKWTANVCFGGKERAYLFITASKGLYRVRIR